MLTTLAKASNSYRLELHGFSQEEGLAIEHALARLPGFVSASTTAQAREFMAIRYTSEINRSALRRSLQALVAELELNASTELTSRGYTLRRRE